MQTWRKTDLKRGFCLSCFGFCLDDFFFSWIRIPRVRSETRHLVSLGGLSQYPLAMPHCEFREDAVGASSPYLGEMMMTDEKLFQMLMFA